MPDFTIPITPSLYVQTYMPWANAVAHAIQREMDDCTTIMELYNDDVLPSKTDEVARLFGADVLTTDLFDDAFKLRLHAVLPQIVHQRMLVASHRLFAQVLQVTYAYARTATALTVYLTPEAGQVFTAAQVAYIEAAYRWLSPINVNVDVEIRQPFNLRAKVGIGARVRVHLP